MHEPGRTWCRPRLPCPARLSLGVFLCVRRYCCRYCCIDEYTHHQQQRYVLCSSVRYPLSSQAPTCLRHRERLRPGGRQLAVNTLSSLRARSMICVRSEGLILALAPEETGHAGCAKAKFWPKIEFQSILFLGVRRLSGVTAVFNVRAYRTRCC